jgi:formyl-CoA transferase
VATGKKSDAKGAGAPGEEDVVGDEASADLPLAGVTVLDLTHLLAGPHCTMNLSDLGARVIKIEPPGGEIARKRLPRRVDADGDRVSAYFAATNRGKEDIVVDLKSDLGQRVLGKLLDTADVVVMNYRAPALKRLGLDPHDLRARYPRLIIATITGFGLEPDSEGVQRPALAIVAEAESGLLYRMSRLAKVAPLGAIAHGFNIGDLVAGITATAAVCAALYRRDRTGHGAFLDLSMAEALMALNGTRIAAVSFRDVSQVTPGGLPFGIFNAADGSVVIAVNSDAFWVKLCQAMERPELAADERFAREEARHANKPEVMGIVRDWVAGIAAKDALEVLRAAGVPCAPVNGPDDVLASDRFQERAALWPAADGHGGVVTLPGNPMGFFPGEQRKSAIPRQGEHTRAVLAELGFSPEEISQVLADAQVKSAGR